MTENPMNDSEVWTDSFTATYNDLDDEDEDCCKPVSTTVFVLAGLSVVIVIIVCYMCLNI